MLWDSDLVSFFFFLHVAFSQHYLLKKLSFPHYIFCAPLSSINCFYLCRFLSGLCLLCHWSMYLFFCQYHTMILWYGFVTMVLWYSLKSGSVILLALFFFLRLLWLFEIFVILYKFYNCLFYFSEKYHREFDRDSIETLGCFR